MEVDNKMNPKKWINATGLGNFHINYLNKQMGPCVSNQLEQVHAPSQNTPGFQPQNNRLDRLSPDNLPNPQYQKNISDPHS